MSEIHPYRSKKFGKIIEESCKTARFAHPQYVR